MTGRPGLVVALLGLVTITVYGAWYYTFGVLLDPIRLDTGWDERYLATSFGLSILIGGVGAIGGGWLLDRYGSRFVFSLAAVVSAASFVSAATADSVWVFGLSAAVGGGAFGALGFYHVTQTVAVRLRPESATRAIAVLTIWGAFASVVFIPLSAFLVGRLGWRTALTVVTITAVLTLLVGATLLRTEPDRSRRVGAVLVDLRTAMKARRARRFLLSQALAGMATAVVLAYQVPAMTSAGLSLTAASFWAGFRGFSQLGGRIPLMPIVDRIGVARTMQVAYLSIAVGVLALAFAGTPLLAAVYALAAGFGIGAFSPLVGMLSRELFDPSSLGTAMGGVSLVFFGAGSVGPPVAGLVSSLTGSRTTVVIGSSLFLVMSAVLVAQVGVRPER